MKTEKSERKKRMNPIVDCAVQMHAWDNKLNVIYMYMSNLSRIVLISWTNDMFGAYAKSIRPAESYERVVFKWMHHGIKKHGMASHAGNLSEHRPISNRETTFYPKKK